MVEPNEQLRSARLRLESRVTPGEPVSRDELADRVNAEVYRATGKVVTVDANHVGKWERGTIRWPAEHYRVALRTVLGAATDGDLGFRRPRRLGSAPVDRQTFLRGVLGAVAAVRGVLMSGSQLSRLLTIPTIVDDVPDVARTALLAETMWARYQSGRISAALAGLPELIELAQAVERTGLRRAWAASARVHHVAATTLSKLGEGDLSWIAAERAMRAADQSDDPLVLASAARSGAHALLAVGRYDEALQLGETARSWLAPQLADDDPEALSLIGMLHLRMAVAAARHRDRGTRDDLLTQAGTAADRLGRDGLNLWYTGFGPANVAVHEISTALDLGDIDYVVKVGPRVTSWTAALPTERHVSHLIDLARAQTAAAADDDAVDTLLTAEGLAPQMVYNNPSARGTVHDLTRRPAGRSRSTRFAGLAVRARVIA